MKKLLCFIFSLLMGIESLALENPDEESSLGAEAWAHFKSPFTTDAKYYLLGGSALTAALLLTKPQTVDPVQNYYHDKPMGSASDFGDLMGKGVPNVLYIGGMAAYGWLGKNQGAFQDSVGMIQATLYSTMVTTSLKRIVGEERPNKSGNDSFPSGHATSAFAFASYVGCRHPWPWGVVAYSMATFVALSRINDKAHYLHDVVAGATIGGSFGMGVCLAQNNKKRLPDMTVIPSPQGAMGVISFSY